MNTASARAIGWVVAASADVTPPPSGFYMLPVVRVMLIAVAVAAGVAVLVSAVRTVTFSGTWTESLRRGPAHTLIGSIILLLASVAAVTLLTWAGGPGL